MKVYDEDLDTGVHSLSSEAEFAGVRPDSNRAFLEFTSLVVGRSVYKLPRVE